MYMFSLSVRDLSECTLCSMIASRWITELWSLYGFTEKEIIDKYGDYKVNPLLQSTKEEGSMYVGYNWYSAVIGNISHSTEWFANEIKDKSKYNNISRILHLVDEHWFVLSPQERDLMNYTFVNGGDLAKALVHIVNVRTGTGFTTHGHTAVDVSLYAAGKSADSFIGHWSNHEIGQLLSRIMDCEEEQREHTQYLQQLFVAGKLQICDAADKLKYAEWNESVPYPWGNLLYPQKCVDSWQN